MASRTRIEFFVSYARKDDHYADPFIESLEAMLKPSKSYEFKLWRDTVILPGEDWLEEIKAALSCCRIGLLLVSPHFLGSDFISREELPTFVGGGDKPGVPVMLRKVNLDLHDMKGLSASQIYQYKAGPNNLRSYAQCGSEQREEFVYDLHDKIEKRLRKRV